MLNYKNTRYQGKHKHAYCILCISKEKINYSWKAALLI